ncbi:MAG: hypothetical protein ACK59B_08805, partial [Alphaproteobacteria bacterium]
MVRLLGIASYLAVLAAGILGAMLVVALDAGVTQQRFETVIAVASFSAQFAEARQPMMVTLSFDNLFILAYVGAICLAMAGLRTIETAWI